MKFELDGAGLPLFLQIAEQIKDGILEGIFQEETQIPSSTEISVGYKINPATVNKGVNLLVDEGIVYKKRGLGMFVAQGARRKIAEDRKSAYLGQYVMPLLNEAQRLGLGLNEVIELIKNTADKGSW